MWWTGVNVMLGCEGRKGRGVGEGVNVCVCVCVNMFSAKII